MDDGIKVCLLKYFAQLSGIADISGNDGCAAGHTREIAVFGSWRVEVVEVINNSDCFAARAKLFNNMGADEAGTTCDE